MINFSNIRKTLTAGVGAVFISALFVVAAVGPVNTAAASSAATASAQVQA